MPHDSSALLYVYAVDLCTRTSTSRVRFRQTFAFAGPWASKSATRSGSATAQLVEDGIVIIVLLPKIVVVVVVAVHLHLIAPALSGQE